MMEAHGDVPAPLLLQANREVEKIKILNTIELLDMWAHDELDTRVVHRQSMKVANLLCRSQNKRHSLEQNKLHINRH